MAVNLVALAALCFAIACCFGSVRKKIMRVVDVENETIAQLHWRRELVLHAAFYGAAVAGILGFQHDSAATKVVAGLWFVCGLWLARIYANVLHEKEEREKSVHWRKLAGMIRSVTRSEILRHEKLQSAAKVQAFEPAPAQEVA